MSIYTLLPLISGVSVIFLGSIVLGKNRKSKINQIFFWATLCVATWLFATFIMLSSKTDEQAIFWDRIVYVGVVFIPVAFYHFGLLFVNKLKEQRGLLYFGYFLSFLFLVLIRTNYFVENLYKYSWGAHTQARFFHHIFLAFFTFYVCLFFINTYRYYQQAKGVKRLQAAYIFLALFILAISSLAFLPAYGIDIPPFPYFFAIICVLVFALAILRYHLFEIRVLLTEFLVAIIGLILLVQALTAPTFWLRVFGFFLLILFSVVGYLLIRSVLTEIKRREESERLSSELAAANIKLRAAYKKLEELDIAKSEFLSIASHQLRTPLSAIKGYISMLLEKTYGEMPEKMKRPLENVSTSAGRLIKLVNDLLSVSRLEAGKMEMNFEKLDLVEIIKSVVEEIQIRAKEKNLYLRYEEPTLRQAQGETLRQAQGGGFPKILIDGDKIRQVILNVVDNGIRYTEKGGVAIKVKSQKPSFHLWKRGGRRERSSLRPSKVKIEISDTGEGMTKYELSKIFESFSRGRAGQKVWTEGVGLGLYIAKKFVELHNGKIWAESKGKSKGSTFYIELPVK